MKVCCISAKAQHGKDTAAQLLKKYLEDSGKKVLITHYADLLKFICKQYFDWNGEKDKKGRTLLQYVGTDVVGAKDPAFWVNFVVKILKFFEDDWDYVLIPDCRYPIEFSKMKEAFDTILLRVERPGFDNGLTALQKNHPSETSLDNYKYDAIIYNDAGITELKDKVETFVDDYLI